MKSISIQRKWLEANFGPLVEEKIKKRTYLTVPGLYECRWANTGLSYFFKKHVLRQRDRVLMDPLSIAVNNIEKAEEELFRTVLALAPLGVLSSYAIKSGQAGDIIVPREPYTLVYYNDPEHRHGSLSLIDMVHVNLSFNGVEDMEDLYIQKGSLNDLNHFHLLVS